MPYTVDNLFKIDNVRYTHDLSCVINELTQLQTAISSLEDADLSNAQDLINDVNRYANSIDSALTLLEQADEMQDCRNEWRDLCENRLDILEQEEMQINQTLGRLKGHE